VATARNPVTASLLSLRVYVDATNTVATDPRRTCMGSDKACAHAARSIALLLVEGAAINRRTSWSPGPWRTACTEGPERGIRNHLFFLQFATWLDHFPTSSIVSSAHTKVSQPTVDASLV
jgi:hypothetical protein